MTIPERTMWNTAPHGGKNIDGKVGDHELRCCWSVAGVAGIGIKYKLIQDEDVADSMDKAVEWKYNIALIV